MARNSAHHTVQAATSRRDRQAEIDGSETPKEKQEGVSQPLHARAMNQGRFAGESNGEDAA
ncbi:hypothetical protein [Streptomyces lasiicapitis]|uniref:hypothetical protein n=1 Tax=Streptomyces lasiicapitis TaxID=1923961 RepID=UPI00364A92D8